MLEEFKARSKNETDTLVAFTNPHAIVSEEIKTVRTNIQFAMIDQAVKSIMVTSANKEEGKSTVISNLAISFASQGKKVLLVDADMREPSLHELFHVKNNRGLSNLLSNQTMTLSEVCHQTVQPNLTLLSSGPIPFNPTELIDSERMSTVIQSFKDEFQLILFDLPPILAVTDAQVMAAKVDGTVFVIRSGVTEKKQLLKAKELLKYAHATIIGAVLNDKKNKKSREVNQYGYGVK